MDAPKDLLQVKIERARNLLPRETLKAIESIDWRGEVLKMRDKKKYTFSQLEALELETELLLCGLVSPQDYPLELENRMEITRQEAEALVEELHRVVFSKIRDRLEGFLENKEKEGKSYTLTPEEPSEEELKSEPSIEEILDKVKEKMDSPEETKTTEPAKDIENTQEVEGAPKKEEEKPLVKEGRVEEAGLEPMLASKKMSNPFHMKSQKTVYQEDENKNTPQPNKPLSKIDPYREIPE